MAENFHFGLCHQNRPRVPGGLTIGSEFFRQAVDLGNERGANGFDDVLERSEGELAFANSAVVFVKASKCSLSTIR
jgi:hypothetical protein